MTPAEQSYLRILRIVEEKPQISQRQLAERLGTSLVKTNYLLEALLDQGYIKPGNLLRAEDKLKYVYLLTPEGIGAKVRLTRDHLARKEQEYLGTKVEIDPLRAELAVPREAALRSTTLLGIPNR